MLVEHHMDFVMKVCDEIVVLDFGRVIATGTPDEVRDNPAVAEAYLGRRGRRRRRAASDRATRGPATPTERPRPPLLEVRGSGRRLRRAHRCCTRSTSPCRPARSPPCSAPTAPARRRCCARCPAWSRPTAGRIRARRAGPARRCRSSSWCSRGTGPRAGGPRRGRRADRGREPAPRRAVAQGPRRRRHGAGRGVRAVRAAGPAPRARRAPALRRRAADAGARPGPGGPAPAAAARRAVAGPGAPGRPPRSWRCCGSCATRPG